MSKSKRKGIGKKLRFEVFKRDRFTCQYCGAAAPDVVLHVDHISPVSKGGDNDILNLVTSCEACNLGKGPRELSDATEVAKQRAQLEELSERREQLEAMIAWRDGLKSIDDDALEAICDQWSDAASGFSANDKGKASLQKLLRKFGFAILSEAIDIATESYLVWQDGKPTHESVERGFNKLGGICYNLKNPQQDNDKDLFYIRGILRNRLHYVNERMCMALLKRARDLNVNVESVRKFACEVGTWTEFRDGLEAFIANQEAEE